MKKWKLEIGAAYKFNTLTERFHAGEIATLLSITKGKSADLKKTHYIFKWLKDNRIIGERYCDDSIFYYITKFNKVC